MGNDANEETRRSTHGAPGGEGGRPGDVVLSHSEGYVGDTITVQGRNFPADEEFEVLWHSVDGHWGVLEQHEIVGPQYRHRVDTIAAVETDASGAFDREWTIPEDFGGRHRIEVRDAEGETVDDAEFDVIAWFDVEEQVAPLGGSFLLRGYGISPDVMATNYQVAWDNSTVGFVTGVNNRGTATAEIRAAGPPGKHMIKVWHGHRGVPYLIRDTQSPFRAVAGDRQTSWTVEVTEPDEPPETAWMDPLFDEQPIPAHYPYLDEDTEAELEISPTSGQAGTSAIITGTGFPANAEVDLIWYRHEGHNSQGYSSPPDPDITPVGKPDVLPTVTADSDGSFQVDVTIPQDIGASRPITAAVEGREVAVTGFVMQPTIETYGPTSGPFGTEIEIELSGLGWTNYENAAYFVYDNHPLGYLCGTGGDDDTGIVNPVIRATGEPGWHFIDVYPSLFKVKEDMPDFELLPHLSYLDNHPVRPLPAFHFAFELTDE
ncbi:MULTISPECIES: hypothetical protein [Salinibaculum]|uniref:hypothetical protein n=1 Tax=Salinibaculum TaxID=2732368 RepID=UPI0030D2ACCF